MFVRIIVIDPEPEDDLDDALVFQMPEHSRNIKLFTKLLDDAQIEWVQMEAPVRARKPLPRAWELDTDAADE